MPSYYNDFFLDDEQDWEPIILKKSNQKNNISSRNKKIIEEIPFNKKLISARQKAHYTPNKLSQLLGIPLKDLENFENGSQIPPKNVLARINKLLSSRLIF